MPAVSANARGCAVGSKPRAHAMEFVEGPKWEGSMGAWLWGICFVYPSVLCTWELLEDRDHLLSSSHPWSNTAPPCPPKCLEHPSRGCELLVCGNNSAGGVVAPKACGPLFWGPQVPSVKPNTPLNCPAGHLTPSWGPLRAQAVSCLGLGNPLKSRPPSPSLPNAY